MAKHMSQLPPAARPQMEATVNRMAKTMSQKRREADEKAVRAEYEIGEVQESGDKASVKVTSTVDGKAKTESLELTKIDGKWYLSTVGFFNKNDMHGGNMVPPPS